MQRKSDSLFDNRSERLTGLYMGLVKDTSDFQRMGRLEVWISELCAKDETIPVMYATPFGGATNPFETSSDELRTFDGTQQSYGFWAIPPDINNTVLIMFIDGHIAKGVWFSVLYQQYMDHMIPNIPVGNTYQETDAGDGVKRPSSEYNRNTRNATEAVNNDKPYHKPHYEGIRNQGLKKDLVRGFSQNGARASKTSRVSGMLSPNGHYWTLEDTEDDEKIRLRTRSGTQLLLDETRGHVYVINKSGKGWVEIDNEGKIMIYGEQGIGMRSKGDINLHADNDIILEAERDIFAKSQSNTHLENESFFHKSKDEHHVNVANMKSEKLGQHHVKVEEDYQVLCPEVKFGSDNININVSTNYNLTAGSMFNATSADSFITANNTLNMSGESTTMLSSGGTLIQTAPSILQNVAGPAPPAQPAQPTEPDITIIPDLDTFTKEDIKQPHTDDDPTITDLDTINTIYPSHEPCTDHDIKPPKRS